MIYIIKAYLIGVIWACYKYLQMSLVNRDVVREYTVDPDSEVQNVDKNCNKVK